MRDLFFSRAWVLFLRARARAGSVCVGISLSLVVSGGRSLIARLEDSVMWDP